MKNEAEITVILILSLFVIGMGLATMPPTGGFEDETPLEQFLEDDPTDEAEYDWDDYHCCHFSCALCHNLTSAGFNATPIVLSTSRPGEWSHMVVAVTLANGTVYVEPQYDVIFNPSEWDDEKALGDTVVTPTIEEVEGWINKNPRG